MYCMLKHFNVIKKIIEKNQRRILKTEKEIENSMYCSYNDKRRKKQRENGRAIEEKDSHLERELSPLVQSLCTYPL